MVMLAMMVEVDLLVKMAVVVKVAMVVEVDHLNDRYQVIYTPERDVVLDETLLLWKGHLGFKQYIPNMRSCFGVKIYYLCVSISYTFCVYTGKAGNFDDVIVSIPQDSINLQREEKLTVYMMLPL